MGITAVLITCSLGTSEFVRIGFYLNNAYEDPELELNPPPKIREDKLVRRILADKPRITKFPINWEGQSQNSVKVGDQYQQDRVDVFAQKTAYESQMQK